MRTSILATGVLVIVAALVEHVLNHHFFNTMNSGITRLDSTFAPLIATAQTSGYPFSHLTTDYNLSQVVFSIGLIEKILEMVVYGIAVTGIGIATYGIFAKNKRKSIVIHDGKSQAPEILKTRLAKGEINKDEFKMLINYLT